MGEVVEFPMHRATRSVGSNVRSCFGCVHASEDGTYCWLVKEHLLRDVGDDCETWEHDPGRQP